MKCKLCLCKLLIVHNRARVNASRTLCPICNSVVHATLSRIDCLKIDMPLSSCQEVRNGNKNVACSTPEVLDDVVLGPFISYSNLVDRIDVLDQL